MALSEATRHRLLDLLGRLYGDAPSACLERIEELAGRAGVARPRRGWSERDVVLITYADQVREEGRTPLRALLGFLLDQGLDRLFDTVHLLPFFPSSSDDGFAVSDYRRVDPAFGDWGDVAALGESFHLMFDLVLNHCSRSHPWFCGYLDGKPPHDRYFVEADPSTDLSAVIRPRTSPLLTPVVTARGPRHVWTTFSADQVDLDFSNPEVLLEMLDTLLLYVARGARIVRLDAVAFLWKQPGTASLHLPETHAIVRVLRAVLDELAPGTLLLTETNVPHAENVSYFGAGDEAHMVYQFSLPPLLLDAFLTGEAGVLGRWLGDLAGASPGSTTFFNFAASHDGIGVRPLERLVPDERLESLVAAVRARGGLVSSRRRTDGREAPYELNATWFSALADPRGQGSPAHLRRFLASQAVLLSLQGIPAVYFHSLVGTPNDLAAVERSGRARSINRRKFERPELAALVGGEGAPGRVFARYCRLLEVRRAQPAFHPDAPQTVLDGGDRRVLAFLRGPWEGRRVLCAVNVSGRPASADLSSVDVPRAHGGSPVDLLAGGSRRLDGDRLTLAPYEAAWLAGT